MKKNNLFLYLYLFTAIFFINNITAQTNAPVYIPYINKSNNKKILQIASGTYGYGWIEFKKNLHLNPVSLFQDYKSAFGLTNDDKMLLKRTSIDKDAGMKHYHFQQIYKGVAVEGGEYIIHAKDGIAIRANGKLVENMDLSPTPLISKEIALQKATDTVKNIEPLAIINTAHFELIFSKNPNIKSLIKDNFKLAYKFYITLSNNRNYSVYVNANNGSILRISNNIYNYYCAEGSINTLYNGTNTWIIYTYHKDVGLRYRLSTGDCECGGVYTQLFKKTIWGNYECGDVFDDDNKWGWPDDTEESKTAATAHWAAQWAQKYFFDIFDRWGIDCNNKNVWLWVNDVGYLTDNPIESMNVEDTFKIYIHKKVEGEYGSPTTLDIIGHEYTHGVIAYTADLCVDYATESGALAESFCDIFGTMIEYYTDPSRADWVMGSQCIISDAPTSMKRSLSNPNKYKDAAYYEDNYWDLANNHCRNGVQNHWFYLLSMGSTGGDTYNNITVEGIGREKAATIAYFNLNNYLVEYSNYSDARNGSIYSAIEHFGMCSNEVIQTINAWDAVNVSSVGGHNYNKIVNCYDILNAHQNNMPYYFFAINDAEINCNIYNDPTKTEQTIITAGNKITLKQGFRTNGTYFHAYIEPCLSNNKMLVVDNGYPYPYSEEYINKELKKDSIINDISQKENIFESYPNPFNNSTQIIFSIQETTNVRLYITNIYGTEILELVNNELSKGIHNINIKSSDLASGIYYCILETKDRKRHIKLVKM
jgi:Zn-dependent metalloprotease